MCEVLDTGSDTSSGLNKCQHPAYMCFLLKITITSASTENYLMQYLGLFRSTFKQAKVPSFTISLLKIPLKPDAQLFLLDRCLFYQHRACAHTSLFPSMWIIFPFAS